MQRLKDDKWCFACGPENPHGLRLSGFHRQGEYYTVEFSPERHHQGWQGITHGGIIATLLDEVMTRILHEEGVNVVTAEITVRYHQPVVTGSPVRARAWVVENRGRLIHTKAELTSVQGESLASAQAKFIKVG
ncbi:MAG: PaaI family thioesterase [candidate division WS1 bacterium]|nr:PaaI family thioesterase [candidate division WS1 bacterium]